ncbi:uncharacterized protein LOC117178265 isoform X2 [Belonocnema kinseyi]|uniref:uncharacterized protein LOC117178265 isoform X2 n=1 Tax=Belonocnema kinseyi TaxID=2817044 RepID=UPI00143D90CE|nr:uncharacterized protein LOC117178265 isoform X2 [Belonocnema kinseyi]
MSFARKTLINLCIVLSISSICTGMDLYSLTMDQNYASGLIDCIIDAKPCDEAGEDIKGNFYFSIGASSIAK